MNICILILKILKARNGWNVEMTVYIDKNGRGMRIGKKLYRLLEEVLKEQRTVKAVAVITPTGGYRE